MWRRPHGLRALTRWRKATSGSLSSRRSLSVSSEKASGVTSPSGTPARTLQTRLRSQATIPNRFSAQAFFARLMRRLVFMPRRLQKALQLKVCSRIFPNPAKWSRIA
jgi:hypothetical protein